MKIMFNVFTQIFQFLSKTIFQKSISNNFSNVQKSLKTLTVPVLSLSLKIYLHNTFCYRVFNFSCSQMMTRYKKSIYCRKLCSEFSFSTVPDDFVFLQCGVSIVRRLGNEENKSMFQ